MEVNLNPETPTQAVVKAANAVVSVTDSCGRVITIKKLNALDRMRLFEIVGSENTKNDSYFGYASLGYHVQSIDGEAVPRPGSKLALEALVQRLDDDGLNAVALGISKNFMAQSASEDEAKEQLKNV